MRARRRRPTVDAARIRRVRRERLCHGLDLRYERGVCFWGSRSGCGTGLRRGIEEEKVLECPFLCAGPWFSLKPSRERGSVVGRCWGDAEAAGALENAARLILRWKGGRRYAQLISGLVYLVHILHENSIWTGAGGRLGAHSDVTNYETVRKCAGDQSPIAN